MSKDKKMLRKSMMAALAKLDEDERVDISDQLQHVLFESELWKNAQTIGVYLSMGAEWDTRNIVEYALEQGKNVAIPKTIPETKMLEFYRIDDQSQIAPGHWGLDEPIIEKATLVDKNEIDLLIVPGMIFTETGYRIGFGGGYYDRFLVDFIHPTVSLASTKQIVDSFPIEKHDIPVNYLITEKGMMD